MTFYFCDSDNDAPCVFSEAAWRKLPKERSTNMARCIRHGELIAETLEAPDKKTARRIVRAHWERIFARRERVSLSGQYFREIR
jgi:hypothetical protein